MKNNSDKKLPALPRATGIDFAYRASLFALARGFSDALQSARFWEFRKKKICEQAIYEIYLALR